MNIIWCCPECQSLNRWEDETCWNCLFSFDEELAKSIVFSELEKTKRLVLTKDGIFSFRNRHNTRPPQDSRQVKWWNYVRMLGRATSGKHMPMSEVMKKYKSLKNEGYSDGEILSIMGG